MVRRISAALTMGAVTFPYALGWYGLRSTMALQASDHGVEVASAFSISSLAVVVGVVVGAAAALLLGPSATAALGLFAAAAGGLLLGSADTFVPGVALLSLGVGVYRPTPFAIAARPFSGSQGVAIAALGVLAYLGINGGALAATQLIERFGTLRWLFAGSLALAGVVATVDALVQWLAPAEAEPAPVDLRFTAVGFGVAVPLALASGLWSIGGGAQLDLQFAGGSPASWLHLVNPVAVLGVGGPLALLLGALALARLRIPPLLIGGVGLAGLGLAIALGTAASAVGPGDATFALVGLAIGGVEVLAWPVLYTTTVRGVHWRVSTAVAAIPALAANGWGLLAALVSLPPLATGVGAGVLLAGLGVLLAAAAIPLDRWLFAED